MSFSFETKDGDRAKFDATKPLYEAKAQDKFDLFNAWLVKNGSRFDSLELKVCASDNCLL
jgi:hypothetical protein